MLVIKPEECIDCGVCEPECPANAIRADTDEEGAKWVEFNERYSMIWPVITSIRDPLPEADSLDGTAGKLQSLFSEAAANQQGLEA